MKIKNLLMTLMMVGLTGFVASAQDLDPVKWKYLSEKVEEGVYTLTFEATIDNGWFIYSQDIDDGGPVPTSFSFTEEDHFSIEGDVEEVGDLKESFDPLFEMQIKKYPGKVAFVASAKVESDGQPITGSLEYMTCDSQRCLPPKTIDFSFDIE